MGGGSLEGGGSSSPASSKRRRNEQEDCAAERCRRKRHLYLALDDWFGGYSIHKLDADDIQEEEAFVQEHKLPEQAAIRIASPFSVRGPMAFNALGTSIFVDTNPRGRGRGDRTPPTLIYDTETAALTVGPRLPDGHGHLDLSAAMSAGEKLYAVTSPHFDFDLLPSLLALSWARTTIPDPEPWDPPMEWRWNKVGSLDFSGVDVIAHAPHPDGHTVFVSTAMSTRSLDTSTGAWKDLGDWVLPFRGPAYFDSGMDAWVGLHRDKEGYVCCCPVASRSATTTRPPECKMLAEKLSRRKDTDPKHWPRLRGKDTNLIYMGDSRFALLDNILRSDDYINDGAVLHVTLFALKYDHKGELQTKGPRATRSYSVHKNTPMFSHAAFWM